MNAGISIAIPIGFLLMAGALCWYLARTKGRWAVKVFLTCFLALYTLETWRALDSYTGWPAHEQMPQRAVLHWAIARPPNPTTGDPGAIYLFVVPIGTGDPDPFSYRPASGEPRLYRIPYSRAGHEQAEAAKKAITQNGRPMLIERDGVPGGGEGGEENGNQTTYGEDGGGFHVRDLPAPNLPPKDATTGASPHGH